MRIADAYICVPNTFLIKRYSWKLILISFCDARIWSRDSSVSYYFSTIESIKTIYLLFSIEMCLDQIELIKLNPICRKFKCYSICNEFGFDMNGSD